MAGLLRIAVKSFVRHPKLLCGRTGLLSHECLLLTDEYKCHATWKQRLQSPFLEKIDIESFAAKIKDNMDNKGSASAIDMDVLANKLDNVDLLQLDFIQNLFYRFRHSKDAVNARQSMSHALIRALLHLGETERLMGVLQDKISYGIFLDNFSANLLLDHFIENHKYKEAAQIAVDLMLQEELTHPLCRVLSWYACHLRVNELLTTPDGTEDSAVTSAADDDEVMYRRVDYIEKPWYDDHFDIPMERQRIGKTLTVVTLPGEDTLSRSYLLLGWALYEKFEKVVSLMKQWLEDSSLSTAVSSSVLKTVQAAVETVATHEPPPQKELGLLTLADFYPCITDAAKTEFLSQFKDLTEKLKAAGKVAEDGENDAESEVLKRTMEVLNQISDDDIKLQTETYNRWVDERQSLLTEQIEQYKIMQKKKNIALRLLELRSKEEKLRFFEEQAKIELKLSDLPEDWNKPVPDDVSEEQFVAPPGERKGDAAKRAR